MKSICGIDCNTCFLKEEINCVGCKKSNACTLSKKCFIAEYINLGGEKKYLSFKKKLVKEINDLGVEGMPKLKDLNPLIGSYINLSYPLPSGKKAKLLDDKQIYLANQVECEFESERCFGVVANASFIMICEYGENGKNPEIVVYKRR